MNVYYLYIKKFFKKLQKSLYNIFNKWYYTLQRCRNGVAKECIIKKI